MPGIISITNQRSEPGRSPRHNAGTNPAFTTLDLPLPLGPTTARKRASSILFAQALDQPLDQLLASEEIARVGRLEGAQTLVGVFRFGQGDIGRFDGDAVQSR